MHYDILQYDTAKTRKHKELQFDRTTRRKSYTETWQIIGERLKKRRPYKYAFKYVCPRPLPFTIGTHSTDFTVYNNRQNSVPKERRHTADFVIYKPYLSVKGDPTNQGESRIDSEYCC